MNPFDQFDQKPLAPEWPKDLAWGMFADHNEQFWVKSAEIKKEAQSVVLWLHSNAKLNPSSKYRTGLWRIRFYCNGGMQFVASTTYGADGHEIASWDGYGQTSEIRPDTIYSDMEAKLCPPKP